MSKFLKSAWTTCRKSLRFSASKISGKFFNRQRESYKIRYKLKPLPKLLLHSSIALALIQLSFISLRSRKLPQTVFQNAFEVEKVISELVTTAEMYMAANKIDEAKKVLEKALKIAETNNVYSNISSVYDLLSTIAFKEGGIVEAENMLVDFIEKLIQLGYPEDHNSIVRFKLKLSRLYQVVGNNEMAEFGFKDCINTQESKMKIGEFFDEATLLTYISSLFWYGVFLLDNGQVERAKPIMRKALNFTDKSRMVSPGQSMVVLYYNAEVSYNLKEYDDALRFLFNAVEICKERDRQNRDLPLYLVKIGRIYILKGLQENANFWCKSAKSMSESFRNKEAGKEADMCLEEVEKIKNGGSM